MKSYTDIEQSKKLTEILPLESIVVIIDKPKSKYGERFVKIKAIIKTWTEVEDIIEYDTYREQFLSQTIINLTVK